MQIRELSIPDAYEMTPKQHADDRGVFLEWYRFDQLEQAVGHALDLRQANLSVSRRGVVRGIHFASVPRGQAKYVTAVHGAVLDYTIDLRIGSPTYGEWDSVLLDDVDRRSVYLSEGLGHAFVALTADAVVTYLVSDTFNPEREHGISPLDLDINLVFPADLESRSLSPKDIEAPSLQEAAAAALLPSWDECRSFYDSLRTKD
ncbi:dTDP-4-dehydrorhamnose 3,5-epimerase family protein [Cryobacterium sp. M15]|uniref:dTDP-4-dehydrorhamnose 3,5-epimerase family protein n=1 Tax=Cryobacterium sp. M15 TaxID=2048291 RepID=UPI000CE54397|nr:dTDP-4-dehydrorhamnose 3,5-epimerase [Cryobacterium sp. M15]